MSAVNEIGGCSVEWGLYRYFLAVANTGSLTAAARRLGVSQPTVGRQIQALEEVIGARLFDRANSGYVLTGPGESIVELAQAIEEQAIAIERRIAGEDRRLDGRVRISAAEGFATYWLAPNLPALNHRYPNIEIELLVASAALDVTRREADIVLRIGKPGSDELVGRRMGKVHFGLFASETYLAEHGVPDSPDQLAGHSVLESVGAIANLAQVRRLREMAGPMQVAMYCDNLVTQFAALQAGLGLMALPLYMAQAMPGLRRLMPDRFDVALDIWLLVHRDLRPVARIGAVFESLVDALRRDRDRFAGTAGRIISHP